MTPGRLKVWNADANEWQYTPGGGSQPGGVGLLGPFTFGFADISFPADPSITLPGATNGVTVFTSTNNNGIGFLNDGPGTSLSVNYDNGLFAYQVHLGTDGGGNVTSTASDVVAAFAALPPTAGDVLSLADGNSGAGLVAETLGGPDFTPFFVCYFDVPGAPALDADSVIVGWIGRPTEAWVDLSIAPPTGLIPGGVPEYQIQAGSNGPTTVDVPLQVFGDSDLLSSSVDPAAIVQAEGAERFLPFSSGDLTIANPLRQTTSAVPRIVIVSQDGVAPSAGAVVLYLLVAAPA